MDDQARRQGWWRRRANGRIRKQGGKQGPRDAVFRRVGPRSAPGRGQGRGRAGPFLSPCPGGCEGGSHSAREELPPGTHQTEGLAGPLGAAAGGAGAACPVEGRDSDTASDPRPRPGDTELGGWVPAAEGCSGMGWGRHRSASRTPSPRLCDQQGRRPELVTCAALR